MPYDARTHGLSVTPNILHGDLTRQGVVDAFNDLIARARENKLTADDFQDAIANSPYTYDITPQHIQVTTDVMARFGTGKMRLPPVAKDWVKTDLLDEAKKSLGIK